NAFAAGLAATAAVCAGAAAVGWAVAGALVPRGSRTERLAWGTAAGLGLVAASVPIAFSLGLEPGWLPFLLLAVPAVALARLLRPRARRGVPAIESPAPARRSPLLVLLILAGVAIYALTALTEPMWANDYVAIWGLKGKTFFFERGIPDRLFEWKELSFSHPEYPLGLPFLYAGLAFLAGRWDDHAMALLFPLVQVATLLLLFGWLRRRGASRPRALGAAAVLAHFAPLYRGFTTGMAEVPLSFAFLLLGTALGDRLDRTDLAASRRLGLAAVLCTATKNEGLFLVAAALLLAALFSLARRGLAARAAAVLALPAALIVVAHRLIRGSLPLRDFDFSLLLRPGDLLPRVAEALSAAAGEAGLRTGIAAVALLALLAAGRSSPAGNRLLVLAACGFAAYLFLPALAVAGPRWLVQTSLARTVSALAPLVAAGLAMRLAPVFATGRPLPAPDDDESSGSSRDPSASGASRARRRLWTRAS
ncbi:MAG TPA: hypothetical protein VNC59_08060, partial [Thermoanaerobaculia bacterium]|nr:hypothetical protein [Thermoanaerobaculia bacterium]